MEKSLCLPRYKTDWQQICAILPVYLADGTNGTAITYTDGTVDEISRRCQWVLDDLLLYLRSSIAILARQSRAILGETARRVPLVLCDTFCLLPVKGRENIGTSDKCIGYVVLRHIRNISGARQTRCHIRFGDDAAVTVYERPSTLYNTIQRAEDVRRNLCA